MKILIHSQISMMQMPKLVMEEKNHPTHNWVWERLSALRFKLNHANKGVPARKGAILPLCSSTPAVRTRCNGSAILMVSMERRITWHVILTDWFCWYSFTVWSIPTVNTWAQAAGHISTACLITFSCNSIDLGPITQRDHSPRTHFGPLLYRLCQWALGTYRRLNDILYDMGTIWAVMIWGKEGVCTWNRVFLYIS